MFLIGIIIFISAVLQGVTGFGFSLVAVPLLSMVSPLGEVVPLLVLYSLLLNILVVAKVKSEIDKKQLFALIAFGVLTIPFGMLALKFMDPYYIKKGVGVFIMLLALAMAFDFKVHVKNKTLSYMGAGLISGFLNGSTSMSGPPVIILLSNEGTEKMKFRKTLALYFLSLNLVTLPMYFVGGLLTAPLMKTGVTLLPAMIIGTFVGILLGNKLPEGLFRRFNLALIFLMGIFTVI